MAEHTPRCPLQSEEHAQLLLSYCARRLDPARTAVLQRHIDLCPACRAFLESQQLVSDALDTWNNSPISHDFDTNLLQRIRDDRGPARWLGAISWKPALPAAAILALWIIAYPTQPNTAPPPDAVQAEQVERALEDLDMLQQLPLHVK
jgi:anti-sigma factor RsiW